VLVAGTINVDVAVILSLIVCVLCRMRILLISKSLKLTNKCCLIKLSTCRQH